jgi:hypothetical protein
MNFFKRARTPEELVLKCCNAYEELAKAGSTGATRQAVRRLGHAGASACHLALTAGCARRRWTTW